MKEVEQMIFQCLLSEYSIEEAYEMVNNALISVVDDSVVITYDNGKKDHYKIETIKVLKHMP